MTSVLSVWLRSADGRETVAALKRRIASLLRVDAGAIRLRRGGARGAHLKAEAETAVGMGGAQLSDGSAVFVDQAALSGVAQGSQGSKGMADDHFFALDLEGWRRILRVTGLVYGRGGHGYDPLADTIDGIFKGLSAAHSPDGGGGGSVDLLVL